MRALAHAAPSLRSRVTLGALVAIALAGCGARSALNEPSPAPPPLPPSIDAAAIEDARVPALDAPPDIAADAPASCTVGTPREIGDPTGSGLLGAVANDEAALVAYTRPAADDAVSVVAIGFDAVRRGPGRERSLGGWHSLSAGHGGFALLAGCELDRLDTRGVAQNSAVVGTRDDDCDDLAPTPSGWTMITRRGTRLAVLDLATSARRETPYGTPGEHVPLEIRRAAFTDGASLAASYRSTSGTTTIVVQGVSATGEVTGAHEITSHAGLLDNHLVAVDDDAAFFAWFVHDAPPSYPQVHAQRLDRHGAPVGAPVTIADSSVLSWFGAAEVDGELWLSWIDGRRGLTRNPPVIVARISRDGALLGAPFEYISGVVSHPLLVDAPGPGAMLIYQLGEGPAHVYAIPVTCRAP